MRKCVVWGETLKNEFCIVGLMNGYTITGNKEGDLVLLLPSGSLIELLFLFHHSDFFRCRWCGKEQSYREPVNDVVTLCRLSKCSSLSRPLWNAWPAPLLTVSTTVESTSAHTKTDEQTLTPVVPTRHQSQTIKHRKFEALVQKITGFILEYWSAERYKTLKTLS